MPIVPRDFEATILENRPVGGYFRLLLEDRLGSLKGSLPGQFINLRIQPGLSPLLRRPFSIARLLPHKGRSLRMEVLYAVHKQGTRLLAHKRPGETVGVLGPLGNPFPHMDKHQTALLVGGGIGVAPLVFLAEHLKRLKAPFAVFLGARTGSDLLDIDVFKDLGCPLFLATDDGSRGRKGFVTDLLDDYLSSPKAAKESLIHACGPRPMFKSVTRVSFKHGVKAFLSWEEHMACGLGICLTCTCPVGDEESYRMERTCTEGPVFEASRIRWEKIGS